MMNKTFFVLQSLPTTKKFSGLQIGLLVSVIVVVIGALISVILIRLKVKKMRHKLSQEVRQVRPNSGETDPTLRAFFQEQIDDLDLEFILNTVFQNQFQKILIAGPDNEYLALALYKQLNLTLKISSKSLDAAKIENVKSTLKDYQNFSFSQNYEPQERFDLIFTSENLAYEKSYHNFIKNLKHYGMILMISAGAKTNETQSFSEHLKAIKIPHEIKKIKRQIFLLVRNFK